MDENEAEPAKEKEVKLYAGKNVALQDIPTLPVVVQRIGDTPLPRIAIITAIANSWRVGEKDVQLWNDESRRMERKSATAGTTVRILSGRRAKAAMADYVKANNGNIAGLMPNVGFTVGSDPEIFVTDSSGAIIPAWKFLPSKTEAEYYEGTYYGKAYWDGFQAEFSPNSNTCLAYHLDAVQAGLKTILIAARKKFPDARLDIRSVLPVDPETLETAEDKYVEFGCMPSINAYGLSGNNLPGRQVPMRFAGGHLHLGMKPEYRSPEGIKGMDAILGVACVSMFAEFDNPVRREYYGLPGEYRTPPHGLEYRALSNAWLMHPLLANFVFDVGRAAYRFGLSGLNTLPEDEVVDIMLRSDVDKARAFMTKHSTTFNSVISASPTYGNTYASEVLGYFLSGAESIIRDPRDLEYNWRLIPGPKRPWYSHCESMDSNWYKGVNLLRQGIKL